MNFARSPVIENRIRAWSSNKTATAACELSILQAGEMGRSHRYRLECRARNVIGAQCPTDQWLIALIRFEFDPGGLVLHFLQAIGGLAVDSQNVACLRIEDHHGAVFSFQLIHSGLL